MIGDVLEGTKKPYGLAFSLLCPTNSAHPALIAFCGDERQLEIVGLAGVHRFLHGSGDNRPGLGCVEGDGLFSGHGHAIDRHLVDVADLVGPVARAARRIELPASDMGHCPHLPQQVLAPSQTLVRSLACLLRREPLGVSHFQLGDPSAQVYQFAHELLFGLIFVSHLLSSRHEQGCPGVVIRHFHGLAFIGGAQRWPVRRTPDERRGSGRAPRQRTSALPNCLEV